MKLERIELAVGRICRQLHGHTFSRWHEWSERELVEELVGCVLGSQVPYEMAVSAVARLKREELLNSGTQGTTSWLRKAARVLKQPLSPEYPRAYRFPTQGAIRVQSLLRWLETHQIGRVLHAAISATEVRASFMAIRCGLGPKQASLFLRNVGWSPDVAVLDVHLLAYMRLRGLATTKESVRGLREYETLEERLRLFAYGRGEPLNRLDLAIWIVMRTARAENFV